MMKMATKTRKKLTKTRIDLLLYLLCSLIWGSTWLAIKFQIDSVSPLVGVFYRFVIASAILFLLHLFLQKTLRYGKANHRIFIFQGICNFSMNYILTYHAEKYATSAIIALVYTTMIHFNILGLRIFFKKKIHKNVVYGSFIGMLGVFFLFYEDISKFNGDPKSLMGVGIGLVAVFFASAGNMFSHQNHVMRVPVMAANAWGMFYGTIFTAFLCLVFSQVLLLPTHASFWGTLIYLSLFGTVIAFGAYNYLVGKIGAERAVYTTLVSPVIAVLLSSFFENLKVTPFLLLGITFCLSGNILTLFYSGRSAKVLDATP